VNHGFDPYLVESSIDCFGRLFAVAGMTNSGALTGDRTEQAAARHGIDLKVVKLPEATPGFVLLPRRWVVERSFVWATRFRRLVKDYERYAKTLAGLHLVAFATLMTKQVETLVAGS
jgi:hypothetical protein